jgi:hypothetical protein
MFCGFRLPQSLCGDLKTCMLGEIAGDANSFVTDIAGLLWIGTKGRAEGQQSKGGK